MTQADSVSLRTVGLGLCLSSPCLWRNSQHWALKQRKQFRGRRTCWPPRDEILQQLMGDEGTPPWKGPSNIFICAVWPLWPLQFLLPSSGLQGLLPPAASAVPTHWFIKLGEAASVSKNAGSMILQALNSEKKLKWEELKFPPPHPVPVPGAPDPHINQKRKNSPSGLSPPHPQLSHLCVCFRHHLS